jgi:hypothetical protein
MPDMSFTLYLKEESGVTLYVQNTDDTGQYHPGAAVIKKQLLEIADFIGYLVHQGYVRALPKTSTTIPYAYRNSGRGGMTILSRQNMNSWHSLVRYS